MDGRMRGLGTALVTLLVFLVGRDIISAEPETAVGCKLLRGVRGEAASTWGKTGSARVAAYDFSYRIYSPSFIVRDLPATGADEDVAALQKAFGLKAADLVHEATLACRRDPDGKITGSSCSVAFDGRDFGFGVMPAGAEAAPGTVRVRIYEEPQIAGGGERGKQDEAKSSRVAGGVIASNYLVDAELALSPGKTTVVGFLDSKGSPFFLVLRRP